MRTYVKLENKEIPCLLTGEKRGDKIKIFIRRDFPWQKNYIWVYPDQIIDKED